MPFANNRFWISGGKTLNSYILPNSYNVCGAVSYTHLDVYKRQIEHYLSVQQRVEPLGIVSNFTIT